MSKMLSGVSTLSLATKVFDFHTQKIDFYGYLTKTYPSFYLLLFTECRRHFAHHTTQALISALGRLAPLTPTQWSFIQSWLVDGGRYD